MSVFSETIAFFDRVGLYDVVLPFLLVFTLVFGVLEKSKILGTEKGRDGEMYTRKNLNAMIAFICGFFVVASTRIVAAINLLVSQVALVLIILIMLMMLIASFHKQQGNEGFELEGWQFTMSIVVVVAVVLIFLNALGWLMPAWEYATGYWSSTFMGTLMLLVIVVGFIYWLTQDTNKGEAKT